jgi:hypothetical protein
MLPRDPLERDQVDLFYAHRNAQGDVLVEGQHHRVVGRQVRHRLEGDRPDGVWIEWRWQDGILTLTGDRHGYLPVYYVAERDEICISPSLMEVVERSGRRTWRPESINIFLRVGTFLGDETPFRDVLVLPPNGALTWRPGVGASVTAIRPVVREESRERTAAVDGYIDVVRSAVARRLPQDGEDAWMPLSGGRDSRHLLYELHRAGVRPRCLTVRYRPPSLPIDAEVATRVGAALGMTVDTVVPYSDWLTNELRKNRLLGFTSIAHSWFLAAADKMAIQGTGRVAYDGIGGDILSSGHTILPPLMAHYEKQRYDLIAAEWIDPHQDRFLSRLLPPEVYTLMTRDAAIARTAEELALHAAMPNPLASYHMEARTRRGITVTQYGFEGRMNAVLSPYMDIEVYDFLSAMPWQFFVDQQFHTDAIARAFPEYAHLPYAVKGASGPSAGTELRRIGRQQFRYVLQTRGKLVNRSYVAATAGRAALMGDKLSAFPILLLQLERDGGLQIP